MTVFEKGLVEIDCSAPEFTMDVELMPLDTDVEAVNSRARAKIKKLKATNAELVERILKCE